MTVTRRTFASVTRVPKSLPHARTNFPAKPATDRLPLRTSASTGERIQISNLIKYLSSPRLGSPRTIADAKSTCNNFLIWLGHRIPPSEDNYRDFITFLRGKKLSEYTLGKKFSQLHTLALANKWPWTFGKRARPMSKKKQFAPAYQIAEIEQMINCRNLLTPTEQVYLAIVTTWGARREEMAAFHSRDIKGEVIVLHNIKEGIEVEHLLPGVLRPVFEAAKIKPVTPTAMTYYYHRICEKVGMHHDKGWGWHSIRRQLMYPLQVALAANRLPQSWAGTYMAWTKQSIGKGFSGTAMAGVYEHGAEATNDPWLMEKQLIAVHPFLKCWVLKPTGIAPVKAEKPSPGVKKGTKVR